jgi:ADP-dependent NAD(P)H-hydrate dehydratase
MSALTEITPDFLRQMKLPRPEEGDKKARGSVLVIAGGTEVPGAALLAGIGALRAGAGRLQIATCARNATALGIAIPEALVLGLPETAAGAIDPIAAKQLISYVERADVALLGPGLPDEAAIAALASALLGKVRRGPAFVFDAGAIRYLREARSLLESHQGRIVITPHAGEMAGLMGMDRSDVEADPNGTASRAAGELSAVVALKGARTFVVPPQGEPSVCREGNVGLATSGSGDVLAGVIAGLLGRGAPAFVATCWGVYLHAKAGSRLSSKVGSLGFLARELLAEIPALMDEFS